MLCEQSPTFLISCVTDIDNLSNLRGCEIIITTPIIEQIISFIKVLLISGIIF